jgi:hypothetical protein
MCIVTGPRIDLAIALIDRMKKLFASTNSKGQTVFAFDTKETVIELNNVKIEAFPSHHLDAMRGLPNVGLATINRDISCLRNQAKTNIKKYIDERLPEEYEKCLVGLNAITKEAWNTAQSTEDKREKIQALSLAKECYSMKLDLLTNASNLRLYFVINGIEYQNHSKPCKRSYVLLCIYYYHTIIGTTTAWD